ncbi:uncharacterized protein [Mytilus edulis]|uniref:Uncharacterized protein n=1 Tax=Mytilus edulis TaxID=6550 RepID=A0A8S3RDG8_MYTED|nr:unnamed protein product [Mytilus edulis]
MGDARRSRAAVIRLPPISQSPSPSIISDRLKALSRPRNLDERWQSNGTPTHVGLDVLWGSQQPIRPLGKIPEANERVKDLSKPKRNFQNERIRPLFYYSIGRASFITEAKPKVKEASERVKELASPKPTHDQGNRFSPSFKYSCGRPSAISPDLRAVKIKKASIRMQELSRPKALHRDFLAHRQIVQPLSITSTLRR